MQLRGHFAVLGAFLQLQLGEDVFVGYVEVGDESFRWVWGLGSVRDQLLQLQDHRFDEFLLLLVGPELSDQRAVGDLQVQRRDLDFFFDVPVEQ